VCNEVWPIVVTCFRQSKARSDNTHDA
jgi:hypothetical protein